MVFLFRGGKVMNHEKFIEKCKEIVRERIENEIEEKDKEDWRFQEC